MPCSLINLRYVAMTPPPTQSSCCTSMFIYPSLYSRLIIAALIINYHPRLSDPFSANHFSLFFYPMLLFPFPSQRLRRRRKTYWYHWYKVAYEDVDSLTKTFASLLSRPLIPPSIFLNFHFRVMDFPDHGFSRESSALPAFRLTLGKCRPRS